MKYSVVIPAYNEEKNISSLLKALKLLLANDAEIIVVDDGSNDDTAATAMKLGSRVIRHPYNIGNGAAIKTGIRNAQGEFIILMDADGQHPAEEIPKLLNEVADYDMVIGARSFNTLPLGRRWANRLFNAFASYVTHTKIEDLTSGFRVVRKKVVKNYLYLLPNSFSYPATLTLAFLKSGRRIKFVSVNMKMRKGGKSKINPLQDGIRFLLIIARIATIYSPFRVFLPISLFFFLCGLCYYLYTFIKFHRFTNMSLLLFTTSVLIFMLSLIAEQISHLYLKESQEVDS